MKYLFLLAFILIGCLTSNGVEDAPKKVNTLSVMDTVEIEIEINKIDTIFITLSEDGIIISDTVILTQILTEYKQVVVHDTIPLKIDTVFVEVLVPVHDTLVEYQIDTVTIHDTINMEDYIEWLRLHSGESTLALCSDRLDNDGDELIDCEDPDCGQLVVCAE